MKLLSAALGYAGPDKRAWRAHLHALRQMPAIWLQRQAQDFVCTAARFRATSTLLAELRQAIFAPEPGIFSIVRGTDTIYRGRTVGAPLVVEKIPRHQLIKCRQEKGNS